MEKHEPLLRSASSVNPVVRPFSSIAVAIDDLTRVVNLIHLHSENGLHITQDALSQHSDNLLSIQWQVSNEIELRATDKEGTAETRTLQEQHHPST